MNALLRDWGAIASPYSAGAGPESPSTTTCTTKNPQMALDGQPNPRILDTTASTRLRLALILEYVVGAGLALFFICHGGAVIYDVFLSAGEWNGLTSDAM